MLLVALLCSIARSIMPKGRNCPLHGALGSAFFDFFSALSGIALQGACSEDMLRLDEACCPVKPDIPTPAEALAKPQQSARNTVDAADKTDDGDPENVKADDR